MAACLRRYSVVNACSSPAAERRSRSSSESSVRSFTLTRIPTRGKESSTNDPAARTFRRAAHCSLLAFFQTPIHFRPVPNIPPVIDVLRPPILILQVIRVLPNIKAHHRELAFHQRAVLAGCGRYLERATLATPQPCPS